LPAKDLRIGQFMWNLTYYIEETCGKNIFFIENDELVKYAEAEWEERRLGTLCFNGDISIEEHDAEIENIRKNITQ
jgi:hypothetical protein